MSHRYCSSSFLAKRKYFLSEVFSEKEYFQTQEMFCFLVLWFWTLSMYRSELMGIFLTFLDISPS